MYLQRSQALSSYTAAECATASVSPFVLLMAAIIISLGRCSCDISGEFMSVPSMRLRRQDCGYHVVGFCH